MRTPSFKWILSPIVAISARPGYPVHQPSQAHIQPWIDLLATLSIRSVVSLLTAEEMEAYYPHKETPLLKVVRQRGYKTRHLPVSPRCTQRELAQAVQGILRLPLPLVIFSNEGAHRPLRVMERLIKEHPTLA